jgi:predicted deacetylase
MLLQKGIPTLVGVVPNCLDKEIMVEPGTASEFWDRVRSWQSKGWTIAQHGFTHIYETNDCGILAVNHRSEFAGLSNEAQFAKLAAGKEIMQREGVWQPVFMAPAHSFDMSTVRALEALEFQYLTDGYGLYPYHIGALTAVPQLFASPAHVGFGVYTICVHINNISEARLTKLMAFIERNARRFIRFEEAAKVRCSIPLVPGFARHLLRFSLPAARALKRSL